MTDKTILELYADNPVSTLAGTEVFPLSTAAGADGAATADAIKAHAQSASLLKANNLSDLANAATARSNLGLGSAATTSSSAYDPFGAAAAAQAASQPVDAELTALASLTSAADRLPYFTGSGAAALATFTAAGRALVDDDDATAQRATLGLHAVAASGSYADLTVADNAIALAKLAAFAAAGFLGATAAGNVAALSVADARTTLGLGSAAYVATNAFEAAGAVATHAALQTGVHGISITAGKTLSASNTLTLAGTDGSTLNIGAGGTLGTAAYTATTDYLAASLLTTKGDILGYSTTAARVPVGSDGNYLVADSTQALGIKWAAFSGATLGANSFTDTQTVTKAAIGATSTDGLILTNTTAAAAGAQQWSPRLRLTGQGWKTTATAASQTVDWVAQVVPVQGTTAPSSNLVFAWQVNGGGYTTGLTLEQVGTASYLTLAGTVLSSTAGVLNFNTSSAANSHVTFNGPNTDIRIQRDMSYAWSSSGTSSTASADTFLRRGAAATVQQGAADAASPVAQTLQAQGARSGTDSNVGGANYTVRSGNGTGTGTLSSLILQSPVAVASGTGAQTQTTGLTIKGGAAVLTSYTVATLPAAATVGAGATAFVTDANATTYLSTVAGGGSNKVPVVSDGTNWLIG